MHTPRLQRAYLYVGTILLGLSVIVTPKVFVLAQSLDPAREAQLQAELRQVEAEQAATAKVLTGAQQQSASLSRDILILDTKIKQAQLNIKAKNILIESLGKDITSKNKTIQTLSERIDVGKESLAQILRKTNEIDGMTLPEITLAHEDLSAVMSDIDDFDSVKKSLENTFQIIRSDRQQNETQKAVLSKRKNAETDARIAIQQEQASIKSNQAKKQELLSDSKNQEKAYTAIIATKAKRAGEIRAALFALAGGNKSIPFGDALKFAQEAQRVTGIRPAFLLAIITQESNLGANVGSCYVTNLATGDGVGKNSGTEFEQVMKAPRDTVPFKSITESLSRDWTKTAVSCPIGSAKYFKGRGFGGGMGPSQFIPSTWELMKARISRSFGGVTPDPWNPEHAFAASAFYLSDLGAMPNSYVSEIKAACKYYGTGGASCTYGTQVMAKAQNIQKTMIDPLQGL